MKQFAVISLLTVALLAAAAVAVEAREPRCKSTLSCRCDNCAKDWHQGYYHTAWGMPLALVVPPTASYQTNWGWGVGNTRVTPICPQFSRNWAGPGSYDRRTFNATPPWPSDTTQSGVNYVRGPW